jgi:hypothetical protein
VDVQVRPLSARELGGRRVVEAVGVVLPDRAHRPVVAPALSVRPGEPAAVPPKAAQLGDEWVARARRRLAELVGEDLVRAAAADAGSPAGRAVGWGESATSPTGAHAAAGPAL